jgi:hypothetical protein
MRNVTLIIAVFFLIVPQAISQAPRRFGSQEAQDFLNASKDRTAAQEAKYQKNLTTGGELFGVSKLWSLKEEDIVNGTLILKTSN